MQFDLSKALEQHFQSRIPNPLGVAVSGGGDSIALLHLTADFARQNNLRLYCATVDHGLRPDAAQEAVFVAEVCETLSVDHTVLRWSDWDRAGNTQDAARRARYRLMAEWAHKRGIQHIALGHTEDDQAETVLMRLGRGAGVDGLSAMSARRSSLGITWERPLLGVSREDLRAYLHSADHRWVDDPSNDDTRFDRIKARKALDALADLGIARKTLAQVALHMEAARGALTQQTHDAAQRLVTQQAGALSMDLEGVLMLPDEIARRLLICAVRWISGAEYAPRGKAVDTVLRSLKTGTATTLEGCHFKVVGNILWVFREFNAVSETMCDIQSVWDGRWRISGPVTGPDVQVRALSPAGLRQCPDWRAANLPRELLMSTPAVWRKAELLAAPLVIPASKWQASLESEHASFVGVVFAH